MDESTLIEDDQKFYNPDWICTTEHKLQLKDQHFYIDMQCTAKSNFDASGDRIDPKKSNPLKWL